MCGIFGYIGNNAIENTLNGLKNLEYRGYDSAGISFLSSSFKLNKDISNFKENVFDLNNGFNAIKQCGEIKKLEDILIKLKPKSNLSVGHTRWATHGMPSIKNSHPHFSSNKKWIIVHNGIIENYLELKKELKTNKFESETDSEIVAHLLSENYNGNTLETIKTVCNKLVGSYAFVIINTNEPNKIFVAKQNSPCVVGFGKNYSVVCSDINSVGKTENLFNLPNGYFACLEKGSVTVYNENLTETKLKPLKYNSKNDNNNLNGFKHYMLKEINEIPTAIKNTVVNYNNFLKLKKSLPKKVVSKAKNILIIGCGTAYHAGLVGKRIFEEVNEIKTDVEIASEFRYSNFKPNKNTIVFFVSQSGETADTLKAVKLCKAYGLTTVAITNVKNSSICFETDYVLYTSAGKEVAVASTKAYNSQVTMFYLISAYFMAVKQDMENLVFNESKKLIEIADEIANLNLTKITSKVADEIKDSKTVYMVGRIADYNTALESSLKLKEISYIHSEAYPAGELKHGTISLIDNNTFVFAFLTQQTVKEKTLSNLEEIVSRGGKVIVLSQFKLNNNNFYKVIKLPNIDEFYMPLVSVVYMQQIAYYTSLKLGNNPDKPRSLAKSVTVE